MRKFDRFNYKAYRRARSWETNRRYSNEARLLNWTIFEEIGVVIINDWAVARVNIAA